jgi:cell division septal protein FtsQ
MARVELPKSGIKARRRKYRAWIIAAVLGLVLTSIGLLALLAHAPFMRIATVDVASSGGVASTSVVELVQNQLSGSYFFLFPRNNIFLYPKQDIQESLRVAYPIIKDAQVHAKNFTAIEVSLTLREPAALWCASQDACKLMDEDGVIYADAPQFSAPLYTKYFGSVSTSTSPAQFLTPEEFRSLFALVDALNKKAASTTVAEVSIDQNGDVKALFQNDFALLFASADNGGDVFDRFSLALESDLFKNHTLADFEYLDLRFGEKLYYKLKTK